VNPEDAQLLAQLRDIHGAAAPGWWPPAPGWWVLALLALLVIAFLLRLLARRLRDARRRRRWLESLRELDREFDPQSQPREYLAGLNRLFRAVALRAFPDTACARLEGEAWVDFIRSLTTLPAGADSLSALARGPYEPSPGFDAAALREQARAWVKRYG
jgi:hypothetical protein